MLRCVFFLLVLIPHSVSGKKIRIPDDLDDVVDSEEDEAWKAWGRKKAPAFDPPPDFSGMSPQQIQQQLLKRQFGPSIGFVKLRIDVPRSKEEVPRLAKKWTKLLRSGGIEAKITGIDVNTLMFSISNGQQTAEVKDFVLSQHEAYEFKLGQQAYRRAGDPPLEVVMEKIQQERNRHEKDEL